MNLSIAYSGIFYVEHRDGGITINLYPNYKIVEDLRSIGTWYEGVLQISADGNFVKMDVTNSYEVNYSWASMSPDQVSTINDLVYIDEPITEKRWFGFAMRSYYPAHTRYIRKNIGLCNSVRTYYNHKVSVMAQTKDKHRPAVDSRGLD